MNPSNLIDPVPAGANFSAFARKCFSGGILLGLLLLLAAPARAEVADDDYLAIYTVMDQADTLNAHGQTAPAHAKYLEAWKALSQFQRDNPNWNPKIVSYRLNNLAEKIAATSGTPPASTAAAAAPSATGASPAVAPAAKSPVKLLDAGSEPRTVLRLHPTVGDKQTMTMTMKIGMDMSASSTPVPATDIPGIVMSIDVEVQNIAANGNITYTLAFNDTTLAADPNTQPAVAAAMKTALAGLSGLTGTGEMTDRGVVKKMEMKLPAGAPAALSQTIGQMKDSLSSSSTPLPEEAVGPGARWEYQTHPKAQGMTLDQTIGFELVSVDGDHVNLRSTITQTAANQKIQNPSVPTVKMDLTKLAGSGSGTSVLDLGKIIPISGTLDEKTEMVMGMTVGQQKQTMDMKMDINVAIESK
jgi:hypothetical protein